MRSVDTLAQFTADSQATSRRIGQLQAYFDEQVLRDGRFICSSYEACKGSHPGTFYAGQLPHIGEHYDLTRNGAPFRIVVVGQEYGHQHEHVDLTSRRTMIVNGSARDSRFVAVQGFPARNPHMKGCTNVLRLLFGKDPGTDREGEFVALGDESVHVFDCFALANFLLCSAVPLVEISNESQPHVIKIAGKRGESTRTMQHNCARHFKATLEILEPTVIVLQGRGVFQWIRTQRIFGSLLADDVVRQSVSVNGRAIQVLAFTHPSARGAHNWGRNDRTAYLREVVAPTVRDIFSNG